MVAHIAYHTVYRAASDEFRYAQTLLDSDPPFPEHLFPIAIISTSLLIARELLQYETVAKVNSLTILQARLS